ncbi:MAG: B12-binding domain-containing radical SAM protein [Sedimentisphaerales bacterium]|nr:B12-binding domain-containing radical SAM protein [Sedimentisphaerales bacterium]
MSDKPLRPKVILVADRTLSGRYKVLFEGIFATLQTTQVPEVFMRRFLSPPVKTDSAGRAKVAPLGLRRVESALLEYTPLERDDVVCTTPEKLGGLLGPWVKIVGISSADPLGMGMSNTTTANFWKGRLYTKYWTAQMLEQLSVARAKYGFKVILGGAGAWQWDSHPDQRPDVEIDMVFDGYFEKSGPELFSDILENRCPQKRINESYTGHERIRPIAGASTLGVVELSRGCGRGCRFCTMAKKKMKHLPPETILADLETNVSEGMTSVVSGSEDFFRYGSDNTTPDFDKLHNLLTQMKRIKGLSFMQLDHANVTSVLQLTDEQLAEIRRLLSWEQPTEYLWVNMGAESANGHLVARHSPGKIVPFQAEDWSQMVRQAADKMLRGGFFPVFSVILGLPGETPDDVTDTIELVRDLGGRGAVIFPVFYEPVLPDEIRDGKRFALKNMSAGHLELYRMCYEFNFKMVPRLFWDNQRAGGVGRSRRLILQLLGKSEVMTWRRTFKKLNKKLADPEHVSFEEDRVYV